MFLYKIDLLKKLKEKGYTTAILKKEYGIGDSQFDKIRKGEMVGINVLDKICTLLDMQPGTIMKHIPDEKKENSLPSGRSAPSGKLSFVLSSYFQGLLNCLKISSIL